MPQISRQRRFSLAEPKPMVTSSRRGQIMNVHRSRIASDSVVARSDLRGVVLYDTRSTDTRVPETGAYDKVSSKHNQSDRGTHVKQSKILANSSHGCEVDERQSILSKKEHPVGHLVPTTPSKTIISPKSKSDDEGKEIAKSDELLTEAKSYSCEKNEHNDLCDTEAVSIIENKQSGLKSETVLYSDMKDEQNDASDVIESKDSCVEVDAATGCLKENPPQPDPPKPSPRRRALSELQLVHTGISLFSESIAEKKPPRPPMQKRNTISVLELDRESQCSSLTCISDESKISGNIKSPLERERHLHNKRKSRIIRRNTSFALPTMLEQDVEGLGQIAESVAASYESRTNANSEMQSQTAYNSPMNVSRGYRSRCTSLKRKSSALMNYGKMKPVLKRSMTVGFINPPTTEVSMDDVKASILKLREGLDLNKYKGIVGQTRGTSYAKIPHPPSAPSEGKTSTSLRRYKLSQDSSVDMFEPHYIDRCEDSETSRTPTNERYLSNEPEIDKQRHEFGMNFTPTAVNAKKDKVPYDYELEDSLQVIRVNPSTKFLLRKYSSKSFGGMDLTVASPDICALSDTYVGDCHTNLGYETVDMDEAMMACSLNDNSGTGFGNVKLTPGLLQMLDEDIRNAEGDQFDNSQSDYVESEVDIDIKDETQVVESQGHHVPEQVQNSPMAGKISAEQKDSEVHVPMMDSVKEIDIAHGQSVKTSENFKNDDSSQVKDQGHTSAGDITSMYSSLQKKLEDVEKMTGVYKDCNAMSTNPHFCEEQLALKQVMIEDSPLGCMTIDVENNHKTDPNKDGAKEEVNIASKKDESKVSLSDPSPVGQYPSQTFKQEVYTVTDSDPIEKGYSWLKEFPIASASLSDFGSQTKLMHTQPMIERNDDQINLSASESQLSSKSSERMLPMTVVGESDPLQTIESKTQGNSNHTNRSRSVCGVSYSEHNKDDIILYRKVSECLLKKGTCIKMDGVEKDYTWLQDETSEALAKTALQDEAQLGKLECVQHDISGLPVEHTHQIDHGAIEHSPFIVDSNKGASGQSSMKASATGVSNDDSARDRCEADLTSKEELSHGQVASTQNDMEASTCTGSGMGESYRDFDEIDNTARSTQYDDQDNSKQVCRRIVEEVPHDQEASDNNSVEAFATCIVTNITGVSDGLEVSIQKSMEDATGSDIEETATDLETLVKPVHSTQFHPTCDNKYSVAGNTDGYKVEEGNHNYDLVMEEGFVHSIDQSVEHQTMNDLGMSDMKELTHANIVHGPHEEFTTNDCSQEDISKVSDNIPPCNVDDSTIDCTVQVVCVDVHRSQEMSIDTFAGETVGGDAVEDDDGRIASENGVDKGLVSQQTYKDDDKSVSHNSKDSSPYENTAEDKCSGSKCGAAESALDSGITEGSTFHNTFEKETDSQKIKEVSVQDLSTDESHLKEIDYVNNSKANGNTVDAVIEKVHCQELSCSEDMEADTNYVGAATDKSNCQEVQCGNDLEAKASTPNERCDTEQADCGDYPKKIAMNEKSLEGKGNEPSITLGMKVGVEANDLLTNDKGELSYLKCLHSTLHDIPKYQFESVDNEDANSFLRESIKNSSQVNWEKPPSEVNHDKDKRMLKHMGQTTEKDDPDIQHLQASVSSTFLRESESTKDGESRSLTSQSPFNRERFNESDSDSLTNLALRCSHDRLEKVKAMSRSIDSSDMESDDTKSSSAFEDNNTEDTDTKPCDFAPILEEEQPASNGAAEMISAASGRCSKIDDDLKIISDGCPLVSSDNKENIVVTEKCHEVSDAASDDGHPSTGMVKNEGCAVFNNVDDEDHKDKNMLTDQANESIDIANGAGHSDKSMAIDKANEAINIANDAVLLDKGIVTGEGHEGSDNTYADQNDKSVVSDEVIDIANGAGNSDKLMVTNKARNIANDEEYEQKSMEKDDAVIDIAEDLKGQSMITDEGCVHSDVANHEDNMVIGMVKEEYHEVMHIESDGDYEGKRTVADEDHKDIDDTYCEHLEDKNIGTGEDFVYRGFANDGVSNDESMVTSADHEVIDNVNNGDHRSIRDTANADHEVIGMATDSDHGCISTITGSDHEGIGMVAGSGNEGISMVTGSDNEGIGLVTGSDQEGIGLVTGSDQEGIGLVTGSDHEGIGMATGSDHEGIGMATGSDNEGIGMVTGSYHEGIGMATGSDNEGIGLVTGSDHESTGMVTGSDHEGNGMATGSDHAGNGMATGSDHEGIGMVTGSDHEGISMVTGSDHEGIGMVTGSDHEAKGMATGSDHEGIGMATGSDNQGIGMATGSDHEGIGMATGSDHEGIGMATGSDNQGINMVTDSDHEGISMVTDSDHKGIGMETCSGQDDFGMVPDAHHEGDGIVTGSDLEVSVINAHDATRHLPDILVLDDIPSSPESVSQCSVQTAVYIGDREDRGGDVNLPLCLEEGEGEAENTLCLDKYENNGYELENNGSELENNGNEIENNGDESENNGNESENNGNELENNDSGTTDCHVMEEDKVRELDRENENIVNQEIKEDRENDLEEGYKNIVSQEMKENSENDLDDENTNIVNQEMKEGSGNDLDDENKSIVSQEMKEYEGNESEFENKSIVYQEMEGDKEKKEFYGDGTIVCLDREEDESHEFDNENKDIAYREKIEGDRRNAVDNVDEDNRVVEFTIPILHCQDLGEEKENDISNVEVVGEMVIHNIEDNLSPDSLVHQSAVISQAQVPEITQPDPSFDIYTADHDSGLMTD